MRHKISPEIREASLEDMDEMHRIEVECFDEDAFTYTELAYCLRSPRFVKLIATVNDEVAGFIIGRLERSGGRIVGHIYTIDVKPKFRRRGIGSALLESAERTFISRGAERCRLEVRLDNLAAKKLYLKHGYKPKRVLKNYYGRGFDALELEKNLGESAPPKA
jgi:ribosomal-protein-alanine N-acetyltransferase